MAPLDAGWAGVLGAFIGAAATLLATYIAHHLQNSRANSLADIRRRRLKAMLGRDKFKWCSIATLAAAVGADENTTAELLMEIDARASLSNNRSWALVSRAPWPEDIQPED